MTLSDARLVALAAVGSESAFAAIHARHSPALRRYCRSILRNDEDAEDALQNAMIAAHRDLTRGGAQRDIALRAWLFRIARNESISMLRRRRSEDSLEETGFHSDAAVSGPEGEAEARERITSLWRDLANLPERQRSALVLRELSGLDFSEIAGVLDTSPGTARQAAYEARRALADLLTSRDRTCMEVREEIAGGDRRRLRGRGIRAHLRSCVECASLAEGSHSPPPARAQRILGFPFLPAGLPFAAGSGSAGTLGSGFAATAAGFAAAVTALVLAIGAVGASHLAGSEPRAGEARAAYGSAELPSGPGAGPAPRDGGSRATTGRGETAAGSPVAGLGIFLVELPGSRKQDSMSSAATDRHADAPTETDPSGPSGTLEGTLARVRGVVPRVEEAATARVEAATGTVAAERSPVAIPRPAKPAPAAQEPRKPAPPGRQAPSTSGERSPVGKPVKKPVGERIQRRPAVPSPPGHARRQRPADR